MLPCQHAHMGTIFPYGILIRPMCGSHPMFMSMLVVTHGCIEPWCPRGGLCVVLKIAWFPFTKLFHYILFCAWCYQYWLLIGCWCSIYRVLEMPLLVPWHSICQRCLGCHFRRLFEGQGLLPQKVFGHPEHRQAIPGRRTCHQNCSCESFSQISDQKRLTEH